MKTLFISFLMLISISVKAQSYLDTIKSKISDGDVIYEQTITDQTLTKQKLYLLSKSWFDQAFTNSNEVLKTQDVVNGRLIGKGTSSNGYTIFDEPFYLTFTIQVDVKDKKYRIKIYDIDYKWETYLSSLPLLIRQLEIRKFLYVKDLESNEKTAQRYRDYLQYANDTVSGLIKNYSQYVKKNSKDNF